MRPGFRAQAGWRWALALALYLLTVFLAQRAHAVGLRGTGAHSLASTQHDTARALDADGHAQWGAGNMAGAQRRRRLHAAAAPADAASLVAAGAYDYALVSVTVRIQGTRQKLKVLVACEPNRAGLQRRATRTCAPVCAPLTAPAALVCARMGLDVPEGGGNSGAVPATSVSWAAQRPALEALTCPSGAEALDGCVAYLAVVGAEGCTQLATLTCGAPLVAPGPAPPVAPQPPPLPPAPAPPLPALCGPLLQRLAALAGGSGSAVPDWARDLDAHRSEAPHGEFRLTGSPVAGRSGVVQLSWCGLWGSVSMRTARVQQDAGQGGGQDSTARVQVANILRASTICSALGFPLGRFKRGSQRVVGGAGVVWDLAPKCSPQVYSTTAEAVEEVIRSVFSDSKPYMLHNDVQVAPGGCPSYDVDISTADNHTADLSVECWHTTRDELQPLAHQPKPGDPPEGTLRLMAHTQAAWLSSNGTTGYVQVYEQGAWGTICSTGWDDADAQVACRQLGFAAGTAIYLKYDVTLANDNAGTRWRTMWMTHVACPPYAPGAGGSGTQRLLDCPHVGPPITDCPFTELAAVRCYAAARRVPPPPPPAPAPPPEPPPEDKCPICLTMDYTMDGALGKDSPIMGEAMCERFAATATAVLRTLDAPPPPPRPPTAAGGPPRPPPPLLGFGVPGTVDLTPGGTTGGPVPGGAAALAAARSAVLPAPLACASYTSRTMAVCGQLAAAAAGGVWEALRGQSEDAVVEWLRAMRKALGLLQPCQSFDTDYDYHMVGRRMTPDLTFALCGGRNLTYVGMDGVNVLIRAVWVSPPPDAPWAAVLDEGGWQPPAAPGEAASPPPAPPPPHPSPPPPRPRPSPLAAPTPTPAGAGASPAARACLVISSVPSGVAAALGDAAAAHPLVNTTTAGLNMTLSACATAAAAGGYSQMAIETYSANVGGSIRVTATCYGLAWPLGSAAAGVAELPVARCGMPCATEPGGPRAPACGTGRPGGLALYDLGAAAA